MIHRDEARGLKLDAKKLPELEASLDAAIRFEIGEGSTSAYIIVGSQRIGEMLAQKYRANSWTVSVTDVSGDRVTSPAEWSVRVSLEGL